MVLILLLLFLILNGIDSFIGKRLEPGYNVAESDGKVKFRVGGILIIILYFGIAYTMFDLENLNHAKWLLIFFLISFWGFQSFMEWKYVEGKKFKLSLLLMAVSAISVFAIFYVNDIITHTTFGEEINELLEGEETNKITILWPKETENNTDIYLRTTIDDKAIINTLITEPSDMDLIKSDYTNFNLHEMKITFFHDNKSSMIFLNEDYIEINGEHYEISGENRLYKMIVNKELEWVQDE
ncbi:DUF4181 domain-containing protein [Bacillus sp. REN16]|uniref:DUF4181 domain-containing protein n=1 Tax=Bacillus sp. REN16 TaxID=2887296 RepID=UPI001E5F600B|nr:DUF4181 domain-containing protein [Bacillus sp. REN16]MCC3356039.1 DUF4181 domain-containing protein [Bacillus sp. REN16]